MAMLHDPTVRQQIQSRLQALRPDSPRKWGNMTSDQMLWHVNLFLAYAVGEAKADMQKPPMPLPLLRFAVINLPWPKNAPTHKTAVAKERFDFEAERARCQQLIDRFVAQPVDGPWPADPSFGTVTGKFASTLQAKHLDHHFKQFSG